VYQCEREKMHKLYSERKHKMCYTVQHIKVQD